MNFMSETLPVKDISQVKDNVFHKHKKTETLLLKGKW